uniref:Putative HC-toxin efflux carrier TOXA n=1 Tax=Monascus pilosus TaxID=89488 RepID=R9UMC7_MONPI|nr:putative HC-toxin efflux carrier TOXA [Monascus pilosus]
MSSTSSTDRVIDADMIEKAHPEQTPPNVSHEGDVATEKGDSEGVEQAAPTGPTDGTPWVTGIKLVMIMTGITLWSFMSFFAVFELGSLLCGVATSSKMLIVGRAVAGMGGSGIQNGAFTIIAGCVPMQRRPGLLLFFVHIPEQLPKPKGISVVHIILRKLDLVGFVLFAPAAVQFLLALQYGGNKYAWNSSVVIGLFCGAGATFVCFILWEWYKGDDAMIPYSMICRQTVWTSCVVYGFLMATLLVASYYLPIYFQAIRGVNAMLSGVYILPSILSQSALAIISGALVGRFGYYLPWSLAGGMVSSVGNGLLTTFTPSTSVGKWIGYQILLGAGRGAGLQMPIIAAQNNLPPPLIPVAMALIMFCQSFFGSTFLSYADVIFTNSLRNKLKEYAPEVPPESIIVAGATAFRKAVPADQLPGVLKAYSKSVDYVFYLAVGAAVATFVFSCGMGWKDIRDDAPPQPSGAEKV